MQRFMAGTAPGGRDLLEEIRASGARMSSLPQHVRDCFHVYGMWRDTDTDSEGE
jgi:hypothetical protein